MRGQGCDTEAILYGDHARSSTIVSYESAQFIHPDPDRLEKLRGALPYSLNHNPDQTSEVAGRLGRALGVDTYLRWDSFDQRQKKPNGNTFICLLIEDRLFEVPYDHQLVSPLRDGLGRFPAQIHLSELDLLVSPLEDCIIQDRNIVLP